ncbi:hypothetical protein J6590_036423 [Homalodisca vitripennis]|nr:hypothetical protein J6590_036423 [Homalodisca vitripennis]
MIWFRVLALFYEPVQLSFLATGTARDVTTESDGPVFTGECFTIMDQPSTSSTNRSELVCRKYYLRLGQIAYLLSERSGAEDSASLDIVYCSLDRVSA